MKKDTNKNIEYLDSNITEKNLPLNIIMSYPVKWDKYHVIRDFVQNFYDAIGYEKWVEKFNYSYQNNMLTMSAEDISFSYEWLLHIGASTKTNSEENYAGYFGEGFKIASLCSIRDYHWGVKMSSNDWSVVATTIGCTIDHNQKSMLAFKLLKNKSFKNTCLELSNFSVYDFKLFKIIIDTFFYRQNKLLGKEVWKSKNCAIYERSMIAIDDIIPETYEYGRKGAVFCGFQLLGTNPFPLVFCLHSYENKERERNSLHAFEVRDIILRIIEDISPDCSVYILEQMKKYWYSYPKKDKDIDIKGWSAVINALVRNIYTSETTICKFRKNNPMLLCAARIKTTREKNRRRQALAWLSCQPNKYILVKDIFCLLDYDFLEDLCEKNNGFVLNDREANDIEKKCENILISIIEQIYKNFFCIEKYPTLRIITNSTAVYNGMAILRKKYEKKYNMLGLQIRNNIYDLHIKSELFAKDKFYQILSTYIHELCHIFGGDSSSGFSLSLTYAMEILMKNNDILNERLIEWNKIFLI